MFFATLNSRARRAEPNPAERRSYDGIAVADGFRLITLGRLALLSRDGREDPSLSARRLKLVLLTVLASARRPLSRDTLISLFWPEQDEARARHSLSDALSHLRRTLGSSAITTRRAEVALAPSTTLTIDAVEFVRRLESTDAQDLLRALDLYRGPFFEGVHVSASQQLEEWIARERARLEALFVRACEQRCAALASDGDWTKCGELAARWLDAVPLSTEAALLRLNSLRAPATRDAAHRALTEYRRLAARLREEYGRGPEASVVEIARALRAQLGAEEVEETLDAAIDVAQADWPVTVPVEESADVHVESSPDARIGSPPILDHSSPAAPRGHRLNRRTAAYVAAGTAGAATLVALALLGRSALHRAPLQTTSAGSIVASLPATVTDNLTSGNQHLLLTDLRNHTRDSLLAGAISEALRVDLEQSHRVQVLSTHQVQEVLRRMERPPTIPLDDSVAREIALRDGAKAIIVGDVGELGTAYTISVQLVSAQNGEVLDALRETAHDSTGVLDAVDRLSRQVRSRFGERLDVIHASPPLEQVTTNSLAALRDYSQAIRAGERDGDPNKAIALLQEAVALDTQFAMAYRKLGAELNLLGYARHEKALEASAMAFKYRDHLSDRERYMTMADYYMDRNEPDKSAAAYRAVLEIYPNDVRAINNLGSIYMQLKDYRSAEQLRKRALAADSTIPLLYNNLAQALFSEGEYDETDGVLHVVDEKFPGFAPAQWTEISLLGARGDFAGAERKARATLTAAGTDYDREAEAIRLSDAIALAQGQVARAERQATQLLALIEEKGEPSDYLDQSGFLAFIDTWYRHAPNRALARLDAAIARYPLAKLPPMERHADWLAYNYAIAGRPDRARAVMADFEGSHPVYGIGDRGEYMRPTGAIQLAEKKYDDAEATLQLSNADYWCPICSLPDLGRAYELGGQRDSAIAIYSRYVSTPWVWWLSSDGEFHAWAYRRLGDLYESRGDTARAVDAYRNMVKLWKHADPELQPIVDSARARVVALGARRPE